MSKPTDKKPAEYASKKSPNDLGEEVSAEESVIVEAPLATEEPESKPVKKAKASAPALDLGPLVWRVVEEKLININGAQTFAVVGQIFDANTCGVELIDNLRLIQKVKMEPVT